MSDETSVRAAPRPKLDAFTQAYIECAFWSSTDDDGRPLDGVEADPADSCIDAMAADCAAFQAEHGGLLAECGASSERAGHDFWLTRNHHGAGFWDRGDDDYPKAARDRLTAAAHTAGECELYIGDDGLIYAAGRE